MKHIILTLLLAVMVLVTFAQKQVTITMDDLPNYSVHDPENKLLHLVDSLQLPFCILINGRMMFENDSVMAQNSMAEWGKRNYVTIGNHTFTHPWYSESVFENFTQEIGKNQKVIAAYIPIGKKEPKFFKFPFNDLGKDSLQNTRIKQWLGDNGYVIAPYTVESEDYIFNTIYEYYLKNNEPAKADSIGRLYVTKTMEFFTYFEGLSEQMFNRPISQIYQSHDNILNTLYLPEILKQLKERGYTFISLQEALTDPAYKSTDYFFGKWGISWIYRWIADADQRMKLLRAEPDNATVEKFYEEIQKQNKD